MCYMFTEQKFSVGQRRKCCKRMNRPPLVIFVAVTTFKFYTHPMIKLAQFMNNI